MLEVFNYSFVNLTPHEIRVRGMDGAVSTTDRRIPPSGNIARVSVDKQLSGHINCLPILESIVGSVVGLPEPVENTAYIVSMAVRTAVPNRKDVYSPGTLLRDSNGNPVGCIGLDSN
jgi:hypothetical protein